MLLFNLFVTPISATELSQSKDPVSFEDGTLIINHGELPEDGEPLVFIVPLGGEGHLRAYDYIYFSITRNNVNWTLVNCPSSYKFNGSMDIMNIYTGISCGSQLTMNGRSGSVFYYGLPGHSYYMHFSGDVWTTNSDGTFKDKVYSKQSGGHTWTIPID